MKAQEKHLAVFYRRASKDERMLPSHVSLFMTLYYKWVRNKFADVIKIKRVELMSMARISSVVTYHKCIRELHEFGYIIYKPTNDYYKGTEVMILL